MLVCREVAGNWLDAVACYYVHDVAAYPFVDCVASLSDVLDAAFFTVD